VARLRIRVGNEIGSAALVPMHACPDGRAHQPCRALRAIGVISDTRSQIPLSGCSLRLPFWASSGVRKNDITRLIDGVDPEITEEIAHAAKHVEV